MKALYVTSLIVTVLLIILTGYFINWYDEVDFAMWMETLYDYDSYSSMYDSYYYYELKEITQYGAITGLASMIFYILTFSFTLKNIKRVTAKVMSIIGLSITGLFFLATLVPLSDPGAASFDEFGPVLILYAIIMLAFCIVNLVQAVRNAAPVQVNQQMIDDAV